jgi:hypothetical protein
MIGRIDEDDQSLGGEGDSHQRRPPSRGDGTSTKQSRSKVEVTSTGHYKKVLFKLKGIVRLNPDAGFLHAMQATGMKEPSNKAIGTSRTSATRGQPCTKSKTRPKVRSRWNLRTLALTAVRRLLFAECQTGGGGGEFGKSIVNKG